MFELQRREKKPGKVSFKTVVGSGEKAVTVEGEASNVQFLADKDRVGVVLVGTDANGGGECKVTLGLDKEHGAIALCRWLMYEAGLPFPNRKGDASE